MRAQREKLPRLVEELSEAEVPAVLDGERLKLTEVARLDRRHFTVVRPTPVTPASPTTGARRGTMARARRWCEAHHHDLLASAD